MAKPGMKGIAAFRLWLALKCWPWKFFTLVECPNRNVYVARMDHFEITLTIRDTRKSEYYELGQTR